MIFNEEILDFSQLILKNSVQKQKDESFDSRRRFRNSSQTIDTHRTKAIDGLLQLANSLPLDLGSCSSWCD